MSFKFAIIGAGGIANAHVGAVKASGGKLSVTAVIDPVEANRAKIAEAVGAGKTYASYDEFEADLGKGVQADGVIVCTPPSVRNVIVEKALRKRLHVLTEKPLAHTASESRAIAELAKGAKSVTAVAYCHRFTPAILEMKKLIAAGKIGTLERFENVFACDLPGHQTKWFSDKSAAGGGAFIDMGCHSLDLYHFVVGPSKVAGSVFFHKWPGRTETAATVLVKHSGPGKTNIPSGVAGVIVSGWSETARFTLALVGTNGMLSYDYEKPTELVFKDLNGKAEVLTVETHDVRFAKQLQAFADFAQGGANPGIASFGEGVQAAEAVEAAERLATA
jgi:predicted dehydrogenase